MIRNFDNQSTFAVDLGRRSYIHTVCNGEKTAQRAFLDGNLKVGGDITMLLASNPNLEAAQKSSEAH